MYQFTHSTATHVGKPVPVSIEPTPASVTTTDDTSPVALVTDGLAAVPFAVTQATPSDSANYLGFGGHLM